MGSKIIIEKKEKRICIYVCPTRCLYVSIHILKHVMMITSYTLSDLKSEKEYGKRNIIIFSQYGERNSPVALGQPHYPWIFDVMLFSFENSNPKILSG